MPNGSALSRLADAMVSVADGNGRVREVDLKRLGFDDRTINAESGDAIRLAITRETTTLTLELVRSAN